MPLFIKKYIIYKEKNIESNNEKNTIQIINYNLLNN